MANRPIFVRTQPNSQQVMTTGYALTPEGARVRNKYKHYPIVDEDDARHLYNGHIDEYANQQAQEIVPRTTFISGENNAFSFIVDMTGETVENGAVWKRHLGLGELFLNAYAYGSTEIENVTPTGAVVSHLNYGNNFDLIEALANKYGIELGALYCDVISTGIQRNYPPEVLTFGLDGKRIVDANDIKKFQDKTPQDQDKSVLRIDSLRVPMNGMRSLFLQVPKGEKTLFRFMFKTSY